MKITIAPNGSVELEVGNGEGQAALDMIRSLQGQEKKAEPHPPEEAGLTRKMRETLEVLKAYPEGCHYSVVAELLGLTASVANSRCQSLRNAGLAEWLRSGVYAPTVRSAS